MVLSVGLLPGLFYVWKWKISPHSVCPFLVISVRCRSHKLSDTRSSSLWYILRPGGGGKGPCGCSGACLPVRRGTDCTFLPLTISPPEERRAYVTNRAQPLPASLCHNFSRKEILAFVLLCWIFQQTNKRTLWIWGLVPLTDEGDSPNLGKKILYMYCRPWNFLWSLLGKVLRLRPSHSCQTPSFTPKIGLTVVFGS